MEFVWNYWMHFPFWKVLILSDDFQWNFSFFPFCSAEHSMYQKYWCLCRFECSSRADVYTFRNTVWSFISVWRIEAYSQPQGRVSRLRQIILVYSVQFCSGNDDAQLPPPLESVAMVGKAKTFRSLVWSGKWKNFGVSFPFSLLQLLLEWKIWSEFRGTQWFKNFIFQYSKQPKPSSKSSDSRNLEK